MIEVERKFIVTPEALARLIDGAEKISEKEYTDIYFDTSDYVLTKKSFWLRSRAGKFELKVLIGDLASKQAFTRYHELEDDASIGQTLGFPLSELSTHGYIPFATITTRRAKYKKNGLSIDIDETDYGYNLVEIEAMVSQESEMGEAYEKILAFARSCGIEISATQARGKVLEYLRRNAPDHFKALETAWGIPL